MIRLLLVGRMPDCRARGGGWVDERPSMVATLDLRSRLMPGGVGGNPFAIDFPGGGHSSSESVRVFKFVR
jgi:hypothetical protein